MESIFKTTEIGESILLLEEKIKELELALSEKNSYINKLKEENELLTSLMDNIPDTIYFKDKNSCFTRINKSQAKILGLNSPDEAIGKSDFDFFTPEHAQNAFNDEKKILLTGNAVISKQEKIKCGDGNYKWVSATKVPIKNSASECVGIVGISRDITERILAEKKIIEYAEKLEQLNITKDKLFSIIAHDLRSPFTSLLGSSSLLATSADVLSNEEIKTIAAGVNNSAKNIFDLLENLLQWAKLQIEGIKFKPKNFIISDLTEKMVEIYRQTANSKGIKILNKIENEIEVFADPDMIATVLRNLISNAIKFTSGNGIIEISAKRKSLKIEITIVDNGIGISQERINKLFNISENNSTLGTNKEKGTGLGLVLCKELIEKNNGRLLVQSEIEKGTSFIFSLPV